MTEFSIQTVDAPLVFAEPPIDSKTYGGSRKLFRDAAVEMGVQLTGQEYYDWAAILEAGMLVDHLADVAQVDVVTPFEDILSGNLRDDINPNVQVRTLNYYSRQTPDKQRALLDGIREVNDLTIAQRASTKATEVVDIRVAEADILSQLIALSPAEGHDVVARHNFNKWINSWSRVGYLIDSLVDVNEDFANGNSGVEPAVRARATYGVATSKEATTAVRRTPPKLLAKCALNGVNYVLKRRHIDVQDGSLATMSS